MARRVRCSVTKELGDPSEFIKIGNKYFKNQEVYESYKEEKESFKKLYTKIAELLGYTNGIMIGSTGGFVAKKIKDSTLSKEDLYTSLLEKEEYIKELFGEKTEHYSDNNRVLGIFKIIETIPKSVTYGGCYEIKNLDTKEVYIGETLDMFQRMNQHISDLYAGRHHCKALQEAFDVNKDFSHFKFTPLYLYEIKNKNREDEKHNTLYLECAYFLKYKKKKKKIYNTINPYIALKEKSVSLHDYQIDCEKVLQLLVTDEQNILPKSLKEKIEKDLSK